MKNLSIRQKILLATVTPVVTLAVILMWIVYSSSREAAENAVTVVSYSTLENSKTTVQNYVDMAVSAIKPIYDNAGANDEEAKKQALDILRSINFDEGNYVFVYQYDGTNLANRPNPSTEGKNMMNMKDVNDKMIIQDLVKIAKTGGDFYQYHWVNPATEEEEPKMSYGVGLDKWGWMVGTGIYLNYINDDVGFLRDQIYEESNHAVLIELITAIIITTIATIVGIFTAKLIAQPIQDMACMMNKVSEGDLTPRMQVQGNSEVSIFAESFNHVLDKIHSILSSVSSSANQLAESSSDLNHISKETYQAIHEQDQETIAIASSVNQMSDSAQEIAANGETVKSAANEAGKKTSEGSKIVTDNLEAVKQLADEITQAAKAVGAVEKRTDEIQSMLEVIHSVTEQTNLLALNAAIEAARAGEQGRGFAVVADEVRSLAMRSAESAKEIHLIIEGLISDTQSAVSTMNHSRQRSDESLERTEQVASSLSAIDEAIQAILEKSAYIAQATEEQNNTAQIVATNTTRIKNISTTSADRMKETRTASEKLDNLSNSLLKDINFFKLH